MKVNAARQRLCLLLHLWVWSYVNEIMTRNSGTGSCGPSNPYAACTFSCLQARSVVEYVHLLALGESTWESISIR